MSKSVLTISCNRPATEQDTPLKINGYLVRVLHYPLDPPGANRIHITWNQGAIELQPTKGLSFGKIEIEDMDLLWDPPIGLPDPLKLNLWSDEICIHGTPVPGATFLRTLSGGIELYGLRNWGMMYTTDEGEVFPLHGETSNIPVDNITVRKLHEGIEVSGSFLYRTFKDKNSKKPWFRKGDPLFKITRHIYLQAGFPGLEFTDEIRNITKHYQPYQWGYHFIFNPFPQSRILVPAKKFENRGGGKPRKNFREWPPPHIPGKRTEEGIILKSIATETGILGDNNLSVTSHIRYPDNREILLSHPPAPYTQIWMSTGEATEFTYRDGRPVFRKPWNGIGIEIGSQALDHDGNTDPDIPITSGLNPGDALELPFRIEVAR